MTTGMVSSLESVEALENPQILIVLPHFEGSLEFPLGQDLWILYKGGPFRQEPFSKRPLFTSKLALQKLFANGLALL